MITTTTSRHDKWSKHHREEKLKQIEELERRLADLKREIIELSETDNSPLAQQAGGS